MCGIFGYVGKQPKAAKIVFEGLKRLEYRGYDSWGIAVKGQKSQPEASTIGRQSTGLGPPLAEKLIVEKHIGKIGSSILNSQFSTLNSNIALGHTRWATHGGVTVANAHPHLDCTGSIALVHNGIVENYQELKKKLLKNHKFVSETDSEVIVHMIEDTIKDSPLRVAVGKVFKRLAGLNAIVVMSEDQLVAARRGSPLVLGMGKDEYFVASDPSALLPHTKKVIFLQDNQMATINGSGIEVLDIEDGESVDLAIETLSWETKEAELGSFPHFMLKEIYEQPEVIAKIAAESFEIKKFAQLVREAFGTFFVACGSASYAALCGTYLFSKVAKKHVNFAIGSEFNYLEDYIHKGTLVIPISQSGESIDVIEPVSRAKRRGAKIAAIVNVPGSTLYRVADFNLLLPAGPEKSVVATKSLTAMVATLILLTFSIIGKDKSARDMLLAAARDISAILKGPRLSKIKALAALLKDKEHVYVIGRGLSYPTALETTLKLKEAAYVHAEGFAGGELKHGVIALIEKGTPCIVFAPADETYDAVISNAAEIAARGGYIIGIGPKNNEVFDFWVETGDAHEATMITQIVVSQLLAYYLAIGKGLDPDKPRNLAKSVTVK